MLLLLSFLLQPMRVAADRPQQPSPSFVLVGSTPALSPVTGLPVHSTLYFSDLPRIISKGSLKPLLLHVHCGLKTLLLLNTSGMKILQRTPVQPHSSSILNALSTAEDPPSRI
ncbi:hypothetical protein BDD12DRAFT_832720 [Trichophaea hybrida]|nr:hypothetical protein BDD12DRAFT_832720 [Trichophaea hybrida]